MEVLCQLCNHVKKKKGKGVKIVILTAVYSEIVRRRTKWMQNLQLCPLRFGIYINGILE